MFRLVAFAFLAGIVLASETFSQPASESATVSESQTELQLLSESPADFTRDEPAMDSPFPLPSDYEDDDDVPLVGTRVSSGSSIADGIWVVPFAAVLAGALL